MYNSDGYVMIDMSDVDLTRSSQNIPGIYKRVLEVIDTNKLALIVNAGNNTPMAAVVHKKLNYYKITTLLYIFTINTNDIVIVEESGEATVDVEIVPTLTEGTKIADFAIGDVEGSLYAPSQQSEINDNVTAVNSTWSSTKINTELSAKADTSDLAAVATSGAYSDLTGTPNLAAVATSGAYSDLTGTPSLAAVATSGSYSDLTGTPSLAAVATSGSYNDLSDKPTIPTKVSELQNDSGYITGTNYYTKTEVNTALLGKTDNTISSLTIESNTKISQQGIHFLLFGKIITLSGVFRAQNTQIMAQETIWTIKNHNLVGVSTDQYYIPLIVDSEEGYFYLVAQNDGNDIKIFSNNNLQMPRLMFFNGVLPII